MQVVTMTPKKIFKVFKPSYGFYEALFVKQKTLYKIYKVIGDILCVKKQSIV